MSTQQPITVRRAYLNSADETHAERYAIFALVRGAKWLFEVVDTEHPRFPCVARGTAEDKEDAIDKGLQAAQRVHNKP